MQLTETHISRLVPERINTVPARTELFSKIIVTPVVHSRLFSDGVFEVIHYVNEEKAIELKPEIKPLLLPEPPTAFLRPRKYDYF